MLKKFVCILGALIIMMCALSGCETSDNKEDEAPKKVGAIFPGSPDELYSESYFGYYALKNLETTYGVEIAYNEYVVADNAAFMMAAFAKDGYDLVIAQGSVFSDSIMQVASAYPNTTFVCIDGIATGENVMSYDLRKEDLAYISGIFAASISSYAGIAYFEGEGTESEASLSASFDSGVKKVKGDGVTEVFQVNNWSKNFSDVLRTINDKNITIVGVNINSTRFEEQMVASNLDGVVLDGYRGGDESRPHLTGRVVIDYNMCYDIAYKDFLNGRQSTDVLGFNNNCMSIIDLAGQPESVQDNINSGLRDVK